MNKKAILISLLGIVVVFGLTGGIIVNAREIPWARGARSEEIKALQSILKTDSEIYPEGYVTGYFGPLTEKAIKRLQKRYGILETGVVDSDTESCIYPIDYGVRVVYPNGGEVWNRNEIQNIRWEVITPFVEEEAVPPYPFWPKVSIDLFRKVMVRPTCISPETCPGEIVIKSIFVKHIATVDLFDRTYSWRITEDIRNSKDYVIRISIGRGIVPFTSGEEVVKPEEIWPTNTPPPPPYRIRWDESDGPFEIIGENIRPCPPCPICPTCPTLPLKDVIKILEGIMNELQRAIVLLKRVGS